MRQDYTEVTDVREYEMGDGLVLVAERHRRRRWFLPSPGGGGWRGGPLAMAAIWLLGGTAGVVASVMVYGAVHRGVATEYDRHQGEIRQLKDAQPMVDPDGTIHYRDTEGKPQTFPRDDPRYEKAKDAAERYRNIYGDRPPPPEIQPAERTAPRGLPSPGR